jgi:hypothetical protein
MQPSGASLMPALGQGQLVSILFYQFATVLAELQLTPLQLYLPAWREFARPGFSPISTLAHQHISTFKRTSFHLPSSYVIAAR